MDSGVSVYTWHGIVCFEVQSYLEWPGVKRAVGVELSATRAKLAWEAWESLLISDEVLPGTGGQTQRKMRENLGKSAESFSPFLSFFSHLLSFSLLCVFLFPIQES